MPPRGKEAASPDVSDAESWELLDIPTDSDAAQGNFMTASFNLPPGVFNLDASEEKKERKEKKEEKDKVDHKDAHGGLDLKHSAASNLNAPSSSTGTGEPEKKKEKIGPKSNENGILDDLHLSGEFAFDAADEKKKVTKWLRAYDLGPLGSVARIDSSYAEEEKKESILLAAVKAMKNKKNAKGVVKKTKSGSNFPMPVLLLDNSGSMGQWVTRMITEICPAMLRMSGYEDDVPVVLITFGGSSERVKILNKPSFLSGKSQMRDPTVGELSKLKHITSHGMTYMTGAIKILADLLNDTRCNTHVMVVSDGLIDDMSSVLNSVNSVELKTMEPLSFTLVRLKTSSSVEPDTRALACLGSWSNVSDFTPVIDLNTIDIHYSLRSFIGQMLDASSAPYFRGKSGPFVELEAHHHHQIIHLPSSHHNHDTDHGSSTKNKVFRHTPLQEPMERLRVYPHLATTGGSSVVLVLISPGVTTVKVNGEKHRLCFEDVCNEQNLMPLLTLVENQMKMWAVMGGQKCKQNMEQISEWLTQLQGRLAIDETELPTGNSTKARAQRLVLQIRHRQKQVISRIKELGNADLVAGLNAQQQAQFLRQTTNTTQRRRLAKRAHATDDEFDYDALCRDAVHRMSGVHLSRYKHVRSTDEVVSFYSLSGFLDILEACKELATELDDLTAGEVLQIVGGIGVGFNAPVGDFPDPWQFRVREVFFSANVAESDVWLHHSQQLEVMYDQDAGNYGPIINRDALGNQTNVLYLCPPGVKEDGSHERKCITGVVPLDLHPAAREAFRGHLRAIRDLQAGLMMRRTLARVPWDAVARDAAVAWCIICNHMVKKKGHSNGQGGNDGFFWSTSTHTSCTELEAITLGRILDNIRFGGLEKHKKHMMKADPRPYFTADLGVSNVLKLIAVTLKWDRAIHPALLRAMFHFDAYHQARKHFKSGDDSDNDGADAHRKTALCAFLGLDLKTHGTPLQPLLVPEPDTVSHYESFDEECVKRRIMSVSRDKCNKDDLLLASMEEGAHHFAALQRVCTCVLEHPLRKDEHHDGLGINMKCVHALCSDTDLQLEPAFGVENAWLFLASAYATACLTPSEQDRVDKEKRRALTEDPLTEAESRAFLSSVVRRLVREDYESRLKDKIRKEAVARMEQLQSDLCSTTQFQHFVELLNEGIPSRSSASFITLHDRILDFHEAGDVPLRGEKLWVLLTGRNSTGAPIWAHGNIMRGNLAQYEPIFERLGKLALYHGVVKLKEKFGVHRYRNMTDNRGHTKDQPNRHGHSNAFPSYWALGYGSIHEYKDSISAREWKEYLRKRLDRKGKVRPAPVQPKTNPKEYDRITLLLKALLTEGLAERERKELIHLGKTFSHWGGNCSQRSRDYARSFALHAVKAGTNLAAVKNKNAILAMIASRKTLKNA